MLSKSHLSHPFDYLGHLGVERIGQRKRAFIDIILIISLLLIDFWLLKPFHLKVAGMFSYIVLIILAVSAFRRVIKLPYLSHLPRPPWLRVFIVVMAATIVQVTLILISAHMAGVLEVGLGWASFGKPPERLPSWVVEKSVTVIAQQVGLQLVLFPLCFQITGSKWSAAFTGSALFGLLHTPNPLLIISTFLVGPIWFWLFLYSGRLIPIVLSHIILASFLRFALPSHIHLGLRVGAQVLPKLQVVYWLDSHALWPDIKKYSSNEYFKKQGGTNKLFIHGCYRDILGQNESEAENLRILKKLRYRTRQETVIDFFIHPEHLKKNHLPSPYPTDCWYTVQKHKAKNLKRSGSSSGRQLNADNYQNGCRNARLFCSKGHSLGVISGRSGDNAAGTYFIKAGLQLIGCPSYFERTGFLKVLQFR